MPAPPFSARFLQLLHKDLAWRMAELVTWPTKTRRRSAEPQKIRVTHHAEPGAHCFELERLEAYGTHLDDLSPATRLSSREPSAANPIRTNEPHSFHGLDSPTACPEAFQFGA